MPLGADKQPWLLASFAMGALMVSSFAVIGGSMPDGQESRMVPVMTAGWSPAPRAREAEAPPGPSAQLSMPPLTPAPPEGPRSPQQDPPATAGARAALAALGEEPKDSVFADDPPPATPSLDAFVGDPNPVVVPAAPEMQDAEEEPDVQTVTAERGDTMSGLLAEAGVPADAVAAILKAIKPLYDPAGLRSGQAFTLTIGRDAAVAGPVLLTLSVRPAIEREIVVERQPGGGYAASEIVKTLAERTDRAQGVIRGSLYQAAMNAGVPEGAIAELIRIYSYDVDFQRDIQAGDRFDLLFTRYYDDQGVPVKAGTLLRAELVLQGQRKTLYRFTDPGDQRADYYDPRGQNGKRMLMKTPIDGARLSSGFGMRRHPVLGFNKMHKGTDFAAPKGTPVMASGHGVVEVAGVAGGYGNYVRLRHSGQYRTAYAHLQRFARGVTAGAKVRQGQIIGYVGSTGRSTGPHLHYEVLVGGVQVDSQSVRLPTGTVLDAKALAAFKHERERLDALLQSTPVIGAVAQGERPTATP
jgi:murein DD-endopeptidase MepM/ murein hydrolase activator NlpD